MPKSIINNKFVLFMINFFYNCIYLFLAIMTIGAGAMYLINKPGTISNYLFTIMCFGFGALLILAVFICNYMAIKFDKIFKDKILNDPNINEIYPTISFFSPSFLVKLKLNRGMMYLRAIALKKSTQKDYRYPWFHGYDFRKNSTLVDKVLAFSIPVILFVSLASGLLSPFVK